jgi:hypothetical protein
MLTAILLGAAILCYVVIIATYKPQAKYANGLLFAIKLPAMAMEDKDVRNVQARFNKQLKKSSLWMIGLLVPILLLHFWPGVQAVYFFGWLIVFIIVSVLPFRRAFRALLALKRQNEWLAGTKDAADQDEHWGNGFTYHNPQDKKVLVEKRVGVGLTVNTGTVVGKILAWGTVVITAVVILGVTFLLIRSNLTTPTLTITTEHSVEIDYPMYSYDFSVTDIAQVTLVDQVPAATYKINGEATGKFARGHFRLKELGESRLYIFKNNPPYIRIQLQDSNKIFYNERDPLLTKQLFERLQQEIGSEIGSGSLSTMILTY